MADWEEVKKLAADFKKVQLSSTTQRLSERNCIEIVSWLINKKYVDLIFTTDGKEYLTSSQLVREIQGELFSNGGRINYVELAKHIGVDLNYITLHINDVLRIQKDTFSVLGQLIDSTYMTKIAGEINEKLIQQGQININELTVQYDLPTEFLQVNIVERYLGKLIFGEQDKNDPKVYFTEAFIAKSKATVEGALAALTRPTPVSAILGLISMTDKLFFSLFEQVTVYGTLTNRTQGSVYIPNVYSKSQMEWISNFYKQNGYLEFDNLVRMGVYDYKSYLKKHFSNETWSFLKSCAVSKSIFERVEADIDECISSKSFVDLQSNLPSVFNDKDIKLILDQVLTAKRQKEVLVLDNFIISKFFVETLFKDCEDFVRSNAKSVVDSGEYQKYQTELVVSSNRGSHKFETVADDQVKVDKREERRKKATGGKCGGGQQGRETKTKSTKKIMRSAKTMDKSDDEEQQPEKTTLEVISSGDISRLIESKLEEEGLQELLENLSLHLLPSLNKKGLEVASELYAATVSDRSASRRHTHNDVQNKINTLLGDVRLYEKGLKLFSLEVQPALCKYLLKTLGVEILDEILHYIAAEEGLSALPDNFTNEQKLKFINDLPSEYKSSLQDLMKQISGQNIEEFTAATEKCLNSCSMILKKIDKKKDRVVISNHKHGLIDRLEKTEDPAMALHLCALIIFISATQNILRASGKHVASVLAFVKQYMVGEQYDQIKHYYDSVTLMLNNGSEVENIKRELNDNLASIKAIAVNYKKVSEKS